jgi:ABC-type Na+ efflux pump permease subunit
METPNVIDPKLWDRVKQSVVLILIGAVFSVVPFYFQTSAMTEQNRQTNVTQQEEINQTLIRIQNLELQGAVDDTEIKQIKESLQRIEKKIDRLIESEK